MRVLLIDDDGAILNAIRLVLEFDSHEVVAVQSGQRGIDLFNAAVAHSSPFDVVVTDLRMPGIDGRQVARAIKRASALTPVILLTGSAGMPDGIDQSEFDCIIGKPLRLHELRTTLQLCSDKKQPVFPNR